MLPKPESLDDAILITHASCMDGSGAAIMFMRAGGKEENVRYIPAGTLERFIKEDLDSLGDKFIIIADVGLSNGPHLERYADILEKRGNVALMDHHITSIGLKSRTWADVRQDICGCEMMRQYLVDSKFQYDRLHDRDLTMLIQDHDLWLEKNPRSKDLASYCVFFGQDVFVKNFVDRNIQAGPFTANEELMLAALIKRRDIVIDAVIRKAIIKNVQYNETEDTVKVAYVVTSEMNVSLLLDTLLKRHPEAEVACQINFDRGTVSFRSRSGFDVSQMATYFGGGGHKAAAGHRIPDQIVKDILEQLHGE